MTLRELSKRTGAPLSLFQKIATKAGVDIGVDTEISDAQYERIKTYYQAYRSKLLQMQQQKLEAVEGECVNATIRMMENLIAENQVFVDASSLVAPESQQTLNNLIPILKKYKRKLRTTHGVITQMKKYIRDSQNLGEAALVKKNYLMLKELMADGLLEIRQSVQDNSTPAQDLMSLCTRFRQVQNLLVITQDPALAQELLALNHQHSPAGKTITVKKFHQEGCLSDVLDHLPHGQQKKLCRQESRNSHPPFRVYTQIRQNPDALLPMTMVPKGGDEVYTGQNGQEPIRLLDPINEGGEGIIYRTNVGSVAKIYKPQRCTAYRKEKITLMVHANLACEGICFPRDVLYNQQGEFVGYLMEEAKGKTLQGFAFRKHTLLEQHPDWTKKDMVQLAVTILRKIHDIHAHGLLVGDINPSNIMVESPVAVYFVDTDSYQVNDLPCQVGVSAFTAPEILQSKRNGQHYEFSEILRTPASEYFGVSTLLFMLMMPGKFPYSNAGGGNMADSILKMQFPYDLNPSHTETQGTWQHIWSHLDHQVKEYFCKTFAKDEKKSPYNIQERVTVDQWLMTMEHYLASLQSMEVALEAYNNQAQSVPPPEDPQDLWLYPNRLKWIRDGESHPYSLRVCKNCGEWAMVNTMQDGWCDACRRKRAQIVHTSKVETPSTRVFRQTDGDFQMKPAPKEEPRKSSGSSGCFITTAVCDYYGKPDDCQALMDFRGFRDNWLRHQPGGEALVREYYQCAPELVKRMRSRADFGEICENLWEKYLLPCQKMIHAHRLEDCRDHYMAMVHELRELEDETVTHHPTEKRL